MARLFSIGSLVIVVFFWFGSALAATHGHHMITHSVSPFDQKKEGGSLHCALKGHPVDQICPEISLNDIVGEKISTDCVNHTSGANSDVGASFSVTLLTLNLRSQSSLLPTGQQFNLHNHETGHHFSESIDRPPQDFF